MKRDLAYWLRQRKRFNQYREDSLEDWIKKLTPIESIALLSLIDLSEAFGTNNLRFFPQVKLGKYRVDFLVTYEPVNDRKTSRKIIVECDGHDFHERTKKQAAHDKERDRFFIKEGFTVFRYTGSELVNDRFKVYSDLEEFLLPESAREGFGYEKPKINAR